MNKKLVLILTLVACYAHPIWAETAEDSELDAQPGKVVFYRLKKAKGAAIRFNIEEGGKPMGSLSNGQVLERSLEPGEHSFAVRGPSLDGQDYLSVSVSPGGVYYVKCEIKWGWPAGRPKFELVSESVGKDATAKLK